jgi:LmbE family N-acetylglucosaminyl deacetylase
MKKFKLLAVLAHPGDEWLGFGGTIAKSRDPHP